MSKNAGNGGTPSPIVISDISIKDPETGDVLLTAQAGALVFSDLPVLTILQGIPQKGGPLGGKPYTIIFSEGGYQMQLLNMIYPQNPSPPPPPPYIFTWLAPLSGGIAVTDVSAFDNTADQHVILDPSGENEPTATFFQGDGPGANYFMFISADSSAVLDGGPVFLNNNSIHYSQNGFELILAEVLYQGQTSEGEYVFQQISGE